LKFENVSFPDYVAFKCKGCGRCCREQPADVTTTEEKRIQDLGFTDFLDPDDSTEPRLIRKGKDGGCFFLAKNSDCLAQKAKPAICLLVPFVVTDWDYEKNLIEVDLPADCNCPGVSEGNDLPLETLGKAAQLLVHNLLETTAKEEGLLITETTVLSKTRLRILHLEMADEA
jgi:Fe-S-cluster containining protein